MSDKYEQWNEQGVLKEKLLTISFLVKAGIPIRDICKKLEISLKDFSFLKQKYKDFDYAADKKNLNGLMFCIGNLIQMAEGYQMKKEGKEGYKTKDGKDKFKIIDIKVPVAKSLAANAYLLEKTEGKQWALNFEQLALAEKKLEKVETWKDDLDEDTDATDNGD